jgi:uncharacterized protein
MVAVWPGMGNVALTAGAYLLSKLGARLAHEMPARDLFEVQHIEVSHGIGKLGRLPRSVFFEWSHPENDRDLLIFIGEAQPQQRGYAFCHRLLDFASQRRLTRVFTFASMARPMHPTETPRVFAVATDQALLNDLQAAEMETLEEGQISGLNGVLLGAAAERGLHAACLLGELPYFAVAVPNPKASLAVLEAFAPLAGVNVDFTELRTQAEQSEQALIELLDRLQDEAERQGIEAFPGLEQEPEETIAAEPPPVPSAPEREPARKTPRLDLTSRRRIEELFAEANKDRGQAFRLKQELDRLGVFEQYEDRFLDLFRKGE